MTNDAVARQIERFEAIAETYLERAGDKRLLLLKQLMWSDVATRVSLDGPSRPKVLEAMCGFAEGEEVARQLYGRNINYSGFDTSRVMIAWTRKNRPGLDVEVSDVTTHQTSERYDAVVILGGLHHVADQAGSVVARLAGFLNEGGLFINLEPTSGNRIFRAVREQIYRSNDLFDEQTERAFSVAELLSFFRAAGMREIYRGHPGLVSYVFFFNPDAFPVFRKLPLWLVRASYALDRPLIHRNWTKVLSFATLTVWQR